MSSSGSSIRRGRRKVRNDYPVPETKLETPEPTSGIYLLLSEKTALFKSYCEYSQKIDTSSVSDIYLPIITSAMDLLEILEQLCFFGRRLIKRSSKPLVEKISECIARYGELIVCHESAIIATGADVAVRNTGCCFGCYIFDIFRPAAEYRENLINLIFSLTESLFLSRALIIDIQSEVIYNEIMIHSEQTNRMNILQHALSKLDPESELSHDDILVNIGFLDSFGHDYFLSHAQLFGNLSQEEINAITEVETNMN